MSIERISRDELAKDAPRRWREQYQHSHHGSDKREITRQLSALSNPTPSVVDATIGNGTWTRFTCDGCGTSEADGGLMIEPDHGEYCAYVCDVCLVKAVALPPTSAMSESK